MQQKIKVLIADDHPVVALGVESVLKTVTNQVLVGKSTCSKSMFEALKDLRPHVLLLDLNMPGNDFYQNIDRITKDFPWVKILVYSGYFSSDLAKSLLETGADGFLSKAASAEEIRYAISEVHAGNEYLSEEPAKNYGAKNGDQVPEQLLQDSFRKRLRLSKREQEVLVLISRGFTSQRIGNALYISKYTVETHRKNILRKLELKSSAELVKFALQQGLA